MTLQSLTVVLNVADAAACRAELECQRAPLDRAWSALPGLHTGCLAWLPAAYGESAALLLECTFEGTLPALAAAWFSLAGAALSALFQHVAGAPRVASAQELLSLLSVQARRATACAEPSELSGVEAGFGRRVRLALRTTWASVRRRAAPPGLESEADEQRRTDVGLQELTAGVPLLHAVRLLPGARARLKAALRDVELARIAHGARFLAHGERLLFLAYPDEPALTWSEGVTRGALPVLAGVWASSAEFVDGVWRRRAQRERRVQEFLLAHRLPVATWFNAQEVLRTA